jgi:hypothetical protein
MPMTLGMLKKATSMIDQEKHNDETILLLCRSSGTKNKTSEFIYAGTLRFFESTDCINEERSK